MNPIIDKIKKLLRMQRGGTAAEVETALRMAQELADKHNLDLRSINPDERSHSNNLRDTLGQVTRRFSLESKLAIIIVQEFFNVSVILQSPHPQEVRLIYVGSDWEVEIAIHLHRFLVAHFRREWRHKKGRCRNRQAFLRGMQIGIRTKLHSQRRGADRVPGIVQVVDREEFIRRNYGPLKTTTVGAHDFKSSQALMRGYKSGLETNLNPAVKDHQKQPALIGP